MSSSRKDELLNHLKHDKSEIFDCSNHGLKGGDLSDIIEILKEKPKVAELNVSYLGIGLEYIELLKELIINSKGLKVLNVKHNDLGISGILSLINDPRLVNFISNINFDFGNNDIKDDGLRLLYQFAEDGVISKDSLLSILLGNPIHDRELKAKCINFSFASDVVEKTQKDAKDNSDSPAQQNTSNTLSSLPPSYFFSKTATLRTSDTSSQPPSTPASGKTSQTSTPPGEESIKQHTRKLSKSGDATD